MKTVIEAIDDLLMRSELNMNEAIRLSEQVLPKHSREIRNILTELFELRRKIKQEGK